MEQSNVSFRRESQSAINLPGTFLFSSSEVIVTEKGISAPGNRIFYSNTGGKFNCSIQYTKTGWMVWYLTNSYIFLQMKEEKNSFFFRKYFTPFSIDQLVKGEKTGLWFDRQLLLCKLEIDWKTWPRISSLFTLSRRRRKKTHLSERKKPRERQMWDLTGESRLFGDTRPNIQNIYIFKCIEKDETIQHIHWQRN